MDIGLVTKSVHCIILAHSALKLFIEFVLLIVCVEHLQNIEDPMAAYMKEKDDEATARKEQRHQERLDRYNSIVFPLKPLGFSNYNQCLRMQEKNKKRKKRGENRKRKQRIQAKMNPPPLPPPLRLPHPVAVIVAAAVVVAAVRVSQRENHGKENVEPNIPKKFMMRRIKKETKGIDEMKKNLQSKEAAKENKMKSQSIEMN
jgi:hypothetical protein